MLTIYFKNLQFHSYHGVHEEEKLIGGSFEVNVTVSHLPNTLPITHLSDTINYVSIYELVKQRMAEPTELLETLVTEIAGQILNQFVLAEEVYISITKLHPPIVAIQGSVGVSFNQKRKQ